MTEDVDIFKQVAIEAANWDRKFAKYFEQNSKAGLPLIENAHDLEVTPDRMKTKPVKIGDKVPADVELFGHRSDYYAGIDAEGFSFDSEGKLVTRPGKDFYSEVMYSVSFSGHIPETYGFIPPQGIENPPIGAKVWMEGGTSLLLPFIKDTVHGSKLARFRVGFDTKDKHLFLPANPDIIKNLRIGFYEVVGGGDTKI